MDIYTIRTSAELGAAIRERRRQLGYTQQELAERAGVARQWVVRIEKGRERAEIAPLLRAIFQLDLDLQLRPAPKGDELEEYVQSYAKQRS